MTMLHIILMSSGYFVVLCIVIYFTRPILRRVVGALAGGAVVVAMMMGAIVLGEGLGFWRVYFAATPYLMQLFYVGSAIANAPIFLVTWRVARRFAWRGLAVCIGIAAVIGPPRDYLIAGMFPEWMVFAPGIAPILADAVTYAGIVALGHAVMRLVAGPATVDRLARTIQEPS